MNKKIIILNILFWKFKLLLFIFIYNNLLYIFFNKSSIRKKFILQTKSSKVIKSQNILYDIIYLLSYHLKNQKRNKEERVFLSVIYIHQHEVKK